MYTSGDCGKGNGVVRKWCCSAHTRNEVCGSCDRTAVKELCAFWSCGSSVVFVRLFIGFQWIVGSGGP